MYLTLLFTRIIFSLYSFHSVFPFLPPSFLSVPHINLSSRLQDARCDTSGRLQCAYICRQNASDLFIFRVRSLSTLSVWPVSAVRVDCGRVRPAGDAVIWSRRPMPLWHCDDLLPSNRCVGRVNYANYSTFPLLQPMTETHSKTVHINWSQSAVKRMLSKSLCRLKWLRIGW